jgi:hypothetical protein
MKAYGVQVYRCGVVLRSDRRWRRPWFDGEEHVVPGEMFVRQASGSGGHAPPGRLPKRIHGRRARRRGAIRAFSTESARRLAFVTANAAVEFRSILTLTYHAEEGEWKNDAERNRAVVQRSKTDLHRFLKAMRDELGAYLWVQEFQARGVLHYHVLCEREVEEPRVQVVWCRAIGALEDAAALKHGAKAEIIRTEGGARSYLGKYLGKGRQKLLPVGVEGAGRWWGNSRSLRLDLLDEVVGCEANGEVWARAEARVVRGVRKYLQHVLPARMVKRVKLRRQGRRQRNRMVRHRERFNGGWFVNWGGELPAALVRVIGQLRDAYGATLEVPAILAEFGAEEEGEEACHVGA